MLNFLYIQFTWFNNIYKNCNVETLYTISRINQKYTVCIKNIYFVPRNKRLIQLKEMIVV